MPNDQLVVLSRYLYAVGFFAYLLASLLFINAALGRRLSHGTAYQGVPGWAYRLSLVGVTAHGAGIISRWLGAGFAPVSNMFEFMSFVAFCVMVAFVILYRIYRMPVLGVFVAPIAVFFVAYASVFPFAVQPLIPALQSYWLWLHVTMAALGEAFFAVAFGTALAYLLRTRKPGDNRLGELALEGVFWFSVCLLSFIVLAATLRHSGYAVALITATGSTVLYHLPPLIGPAGVEPGSATRLLGLALPLVEGTAWLSGRNANTLLYALGLGSLLYGLLRLVLRQPLRAAVGRVVQGMDARLLDEISYRAVAIGYPIFTLGALVFAMIWAQYSWGRYWGWDPKEVWALISWLIYSAYLHLRISRGWEGKPAAWTAVLGFGVVLFTLVGVNLLLVGLHSYAGGDM